jgi:hypothetical protein
MHGHLFTQHILWLLVMISRKNAKEGIIKDSLQFRYGIEVQA